MNDEIKELLFLLHNDRLTEAGKRKLEQEIERLNSIIKEVREYIKSHREAVDEKGEHIIYFLKDDFDEEDILEILDKSGD